MERTYFIHYRAHFIQFLWADIRAVGEAKLRAGIST